MDEPRFLIREALEQSDVDLFYVNFPNLFSIKLHHGGNFSKFPGREYNRPIIHFVDMLDVDKFSVHELDGILEQLEYPRKKIRFYHYLVPGSDLDWGLKALGSDDDVRGFAKYIGPWKLMNVYVEHDTTNLHTYFCSPSKVVLEEIIDEEHIAREIVTDRSNVVKKRLLLEWQGSVEQDKDKQAEQVGDMVDQQDNQSEQVGDMVDQQANQFEQVEQDQFDIRNEDPDFDPLFGENVFGVQSTNDLDLNTRSKFVFMSDRQKGLIQAVDKLFPSAEHRYCVRHITENMKNIFKGKMYRDALWKLATCTTPAHYEREMNNLKKLNKRAHLWVSKIPPETWSRSHFTARAISDVLTNNMCECFNSKLVDGRDKPIITLLEYIREYLMRKIVNVLKVIDRSSGLLTPYATKMMESVKKEANRYTVHWNGEEHYQVTGPNGDQCVVNMTTKTCACRIWEVTGIPCRHVVASIWVKAAHDPSVDRPETFVNPIYTMDRWKAVYNYKVYPINGMSMWPTSNCPIQITAPKFKKQAGRPKKSRKKSMVEKEDGGSRKKPKVTEKGKQKAVEAVEGEACKQKSTMRKSRPSRPKGSNACGACGQNGHNKRSCMANVAD